MKKIFFASLAAVGLMLSSCDSYFDINQNPNQPSASDVTSSMIMPAVEMNLASSYGDFMRIVGGYHAQHYAQEFGTSNYVDYSAFYMSATRSSGTYTQLMQRVISNAQTIIEKSEAAEDWGTYLAATTMRAFTFEALVDCYGEIPYTEALTEATSPKYDDGATIYAGILAELENAKSKANKSNTVCTNFLYPGENADNWIKFANSLMLRILTRESGVADVQAKIKALIDENNFITSDVQWAGCWSSEAGSMSPFFAEEFATNWGSTQINVVPNVAILGTMIEDGYTDPRLAAFFTKGGNGKYNGYISSNVQIVNGTKDANGTACDANYFSRPIASYDMPVVILSLSDVEFYIAEYYAKAGNSSAAQAHYNAAIEASFASAGVDGVEEYISKHPYDNANWKQVIGIQKWIANSGFNGFEAWCEARRLNVPAFSDQRGEDFDNGSVFDPSAYKAGTFYTPKNTRSEIGSNSLCERWPYPESSTARNSNAPKFPGHTVPVFWGK